jgi:putative salt-induced outer membrane protein YdiY
MWTFRTVGDISFASVVVVFLAAGLAGFGTATMASQPLPGSTEVASDEYRPPQPSTGITDWIQFKNGEWLKGEIKDLQDQSFSFESDELDSLQLDWDDIHTVYSPRQHTCVFEDNSSVLGRIRIVGDRFTVTTPEGEKRYDRADLRSIIPGGRSERDYWSLKYTLGLTVRRGNTDQTDLSSFLNVKRRSPEARTRFELRGTYGTYEDEETVNNQFANLRHDIFMSRRLYLTAPSVQYYRDKFENIDYRLTPGLSLGYEIIDRGDIEWNAGLGGGYQYTRFDEVEPGEDSSVGGAAILGATDFTWELTEKLDFELQYNTTIGLDEDLSNDHHALATLSFDVWRELEFDVSLTWDRIGSPQRTSDGAEPDQDDVRLYVGIGWEF